MCTAREGHQLAGAALMDTNGYVFQEQRVEVAEKMQAVRHW
jgi:hypothetical protein